MSSIRVKICGLKTQPALEAALDAGADYVGFVFYPKSPRNISYADAAKLAKLAHGKAQVVALLVDPDDAQVHDVLQIVNPGIMQLHGHETPQRVAEVAAIARRPVIKAIPVASQADAMSATGYASSAAMILFDAKPPPVTPGPGGSTFLPGGNGIAFDWNLLASVKDAVPYMLSGGLTPDNVADAIRQTGATHVDVSSGVESAPGVKDPELIRRFIRAAKAAKQMPTFAR